VYRYVVDLFYGKPMKTH